MKWRARLALAAAVTAAGCAGPRLVSDVPVKIGRPYQVSGRTYVPADDRGYDEVGMASWYGREASGRTANGERQEVKAIAGAHRTLPLPSYVEVTALSSGRTILVRINDRGPFVAGRIVDLSPAAARELGTLRDGVARVRVRRVFPPEAERRRLRSGRAVAARASASAADLAMLNGRFVGMAARSRAARPATTAPAGLYVQVAAFDDAALAGALAGEVGGRVVRIRNWTCVCVGPFADDAGATEALAKLRASGYDDARLVRDTASVPLIPMPEGPR